MEATTRRKDEGTDNRKKTAKISYTVNYHNCYRVEKIHLNYTRAHAREYTFAGAMQSGVLPIMHTRL